VTGHGNPCGSVGIGVGKGGSVGSDGVLLGIAVGVGTSDGAGVVGAMVAGRAVGAEVGATDGVDVRVSSVAGGVTDAGTRDARGGVDPLVGVTSGDAAGVGEESPVTGRTPASRVRLNPARTRPTASDGPRRTYKVKDARPPWPGARSPDFPSGTPTPGR